MTWKQMVATLALGMSLGWFGLPTLAQGGNTFKGRLSKYPVDAKMVPILVGTGNVTSTLNGTRLIINGTFEGLDTNAISAQLHDTKFRGTHGPVSAELTVSKAAADTVSGQVTLTPEQIESLKAGRLYVQL